MCLGSVLPRRRLDCDGLVIIILFSSEFTALALPPPSLEKMNKCEPNAKYFSDVMSALANQKETRSKIEAQQTRSKNGTTSSQGNHGATRWQRERRRRRGEQRRRRRWRAGGDERARRVHRQGKAPSIFVRWEGSKVSQPCLESKIWLLVVRGANCGR